ncbi:MAG TPA: DegV family protein [Anaerolineaceae bacterium]|nr:DegV family protein [Anaerolineaceae bacterium]
MIKIVTDGTADMPAGWPAEYEIHVLPLRVHFGEETYTQGEDFDFNTFYRLVDEKKQIPKTTLPSPQQLIDFYRKIAEKGDEILSIHVGGKLSGTLAVVQAAAEELREELCIFPFDSDASSAALGFMCREARQMARTGASMKEIIASLTGVRERLEIVFTIDRLDFARMSGRVTVLQSTLASMMNIKPIIVLKEGLLEMGGRVRTRKAALDKLVELIGNKIGGQQLNLAVVHAAAPEVAHQLLELIRGKLDICETIVLDLAIPVAAHLGPGAVGIVAYPIRGE